MASFSSTIRDRFYHKMTSLVSFILKVIMLVQLSDSENRNPALTYLISSFKSYVISDTSHSADITELNLPKSCTISFPNGKDDLMNFEITIQPDEGYYMSGKFLFSFEVSPIYPHEAPKVKCNTLVELILFLLVYHPNIDLEGNVCLNILREDWKPVLNINTIVYGLYHLFTAPNPEDPLNHDAAEMLRNNPNKFESNVKHAMSGGYVGNTYFTKCV
ncbi:hypothetical protein RJ639_034268 [Escallonia herrerae]|uniref:UBC core domain-containing protein n=1 Tax=Escallonia herrerae TaxID=1293975 RepID=A0AA88X0S0_9ASTE|nr:hypothetical protein RJ639_034268 [Escallonia herrerae]